MKSTKDFTGKEIAELVKKDIQERIDNPNEIPSGEDALMQAYQQSLSICMEIRGWIEERDKPKRDIFNNNQF